MQHALWIIYRTRYVAKNNKKKKEREKEKTEKQEKKRKVQKVSLVSAWKGDDFWSSRAIRCVTMCHLSNIGLLLGWVMIRGTRQRVGSGEEAAGNERFLLSSFLSLFSFSLFSTPLRLETPRQWRKEKGETGTTSRHGGCRGFWTIVELGAWKGDEEFFSLSMDGARITSIRRYVSNNWNRIR